MSHFNFAALIEFIKRLFEFFKSIYEKIAGSEDESVTA